MDDRATARHDSHLDKYVEHLGPEREGEWECGSQASCSVVGQVELGVLLRH
eukprot:COSAG02_NODE_132_length_34701_cov_707.955234_12_plen_51_part_00